jgi:hypothetical protein
MIVDIVDRLEADARLTDLARGFRAETADPAWFLGRQWQLGELQGEDASSPIGVRYRARQTPIEPIAAQPGLDPRRVAAEAVVESEPGDFWTPGRRVRVGRAVASAAAAAGSSLPDEPGLRLGGLPVPYDELDGSGYDGRQLWLNRSRLNLQAAWFGPTPPPDEPADLWDPAEFSYAAQFSVGDATLVLARHDGGDLDWQSVDGVGLLATPSTPVDAVSVYPARLEYPGAPNPRWWQIEDTQVDIGGYPPDRSHFATLLLIDLIASHSDDWFTFPIDAAPGHVVTLDEVVVVDSFGDEWALDPPAGWSLFKTFGLDDRSLVLWATTSTPLVGPVLDEVTIGIDEDANLVWAVERRLSGRDLPTDPDPDPDPPAHLDASGRQGFAYRASTRVPRYWHPYVVQEIDGRRRFVQGRAADLSGPIAVLLPPPLSDLLHDPRSGGVHPVHQIEPAAIMDDGLRLQRRAMLARATDGQPVLWTQRRRQPLLTPPGLRLRFDTLEPVPPS